MKKDLYFIAEIGKACNGNLEYCWKLLKKCKEAGVNAIRFHHFFLEENVHASVLQNVSATERAWSFALKLPFIDETLCSESGYITILEWCKELGLDFIAAPWDLKSFEIFKRIGIENYKINSMNSMNIPLISEVLSNRRKLYLSTGGMSEAQVEMLCSRLRLSEYNVTLMHTVSAYPTPKTIVNMQAISVLKKYINAVGYSGNDILKTSIMAACAAGAEIIEKHVHLHDGEAHLHKASINIDQYAGMISDVKEMITVMGQITKHESRGEMVNQEILSKSLVLKEDVPKGTVLNQNNLQLQLPPKGINVKQWFEVIGKEATRNLQKGSYLYSNDVYRTETGNSSVHLVRQKNNADTFEFTPGKKGVVARLKDLDEMIENRNVEYVEIHYAASDLKKEDVCKDYDLDLVVHLPEYADGIMLDLCTYDEKLRQFSIDVINKVMQKARALKPHFKKCTGDLKFIVHPGALTYPYLLDNPKKQYQLFADSMQKMDSTGLEILVENMLAFAWFLDEDWAPKQGVTNAFMDADDMLNFCRTYNYSMCLDLCHARLYCNYHSKDYLEYIKKVKPIVKHLHFSDCVGIDSEGLQIGEGEINWDEICEVYSDHQYGWTPEIWNGHYDHGEKFFEAHRRLNRKFMELRQRYDARKNNSR